MQFLSLRQLGSEEIPTFPKLSLVADCSGALPFGRTYFDTLDLIKNGGVEKSLKKDSHNTISDDKIVIPTNVTFKNLASFSYYDLLGLGAMGASVDNDTIKKAYHKAVLLYHPDKKQMKSADLEEDRQVFLKVQAAHNTLTNETKRRAYDSQLDFDDSVPTEKEEVKALKKGAAGFCQLFGPVFHRNARFAIKKPVPDIGDENTPVEQVYAFYDYWINFDSWRDFSTVGVEHKPEQAASREEKRWMIKENDRISKKNKKKEIARVTDLTMRCMEKDPRIVADKAAQKKAKESVKLAKESESRKKEEEMEAARKFYEEEELAAIERAKNSKVEKEKLKKLQSKARNIFRKLARAAGEATNSPFTEDEIESLCTSLELTDLTAVNDAMGGEAGTKNTTDLIPAGIEVAKKHLEDSKRSKENAELEEQLHKEEKRIATENRNKDDASRKKGIDHVWTKEEMSILSKGIAKFPAGTRQRWTTICAYMNDLLRPLTAYTEDECMRAAHSAVSSGTKAMISATSTTTTAVGEANWSQAQQKALEAGLAQYPNTMEKELRWTQIAAGVEGKTKQECINRYTHLKEALQSKHGK